jgi:hypothetical protein
MNPRNNPQLFDNDDLQILHALDQTPVPPHSKDRIRQRLQLENLESIESSNTLNSVDDLLTTPATQSSSQPVEPKRRLERARNWLLQNRRTAIGATVAASLCFAVGLYLFARPIDRSQLALISSQMLDEQLAAQPSWIERQPTDLRAWLRSFELDRIPRTISHMTLHRSPLGKQGKLWKLTFEGLEDLYILDIEGCGALQDIGPRLDALQPGLNSWSVAASKHDQHLLVYMTKGSLDSYVRLVPLA